MSGAAKRICTEEEFPESLALFLAEGIEARRREIAAGLVFLKAARQRMAGRRWRRLDAAIAAYEEMETALARCMSPGHGDQADTVVLDMEAIEKTLEVAARVRAASQEILGRKVEAPSGGGRPH